MPPLSSTPSLRAETPFEFAERVLFAETLEEKLREPAELDFKISPPRKPLDAVSPLEPGRPESLKFAKTGSTRPALPSAPALVEESSRATLLHFFANHELLAAELMALAILRFSDAPPPFLRGLCQTLKEEQRHTKWYLRRMQHCEVEFGEYPVNRFFWDCVSTMESPLDYVSRLSLTFEQANLDYSRHYAGILEKAGDPQSAAILERIYRDEISHVGYGLRWFRKWKSSSQADWEALDHQLTFPLSPIRAKGNQTPFNEEGRRAAGFDEEYIRKLSLYERSRGRTPNVYYFNPEAENRAAIAPEPYHPPRRVRWVMDDLEALVLFLAKRDDLALMRQVPSESHRKKLSEAGFLLPEIESLAVNGHLHSDSLLQERKIHRFQPWSKAPDLEDQFGPLARNECNGTGSWKWRTGNQALFSKNDQARAFPDWWGASFPIRRREDLENALTYFREEEIDEVILKQGFSTAGSGMKRLGLPDLQDLLDRGFKESSKNHPNLLLEPRHSRVFDFSVQFEVEAGKLRRLATVEQCIAPSGGYRGTLALPKFCHGLDPKLSRFLMTEVLPVYEKGSAFHRALEGWASSFQFSGALGVDSYVYRDGDGELAHRVLCEINPRYTMGRVAFELRKQVAPGHGIRLEMVKASACSGRKLDCERLDGRLSEGQFLLTEPGPDSYFAALLHVSKQGQDLRHPA